VSTVATVSHHPYVDHARPPADQAGRDRRRDDDQPRRRARRGRRGRAAGNPRARRDELMALLKACPACGRSITAPSTVAGMVSSCTCTPAAALEFAGGRMAALKLAGGPDAGRRPDAALEPRTQTSPTLSGALRVRRRSSSRPRRLSSARARVRRHPPRARVRAPRARALAAGHRPTRRRLTMSTCPTISQTRLERRSCRSPRSVSGQSERNWTGCRLSTKRHETSRRSPHG